MCTHTDATQAKIMGGIVVSVFGNKIFLEHNHFLQHNTIYWYIAHTGKKYIVVLNISNSSGKDKFAQDKCC